MEEERENEKGKGNERWTAAITNLTEMTTNLDSLQNLLLKKAVYVDHETFAKASLCSDQARTIKVCYGKLLVNDVVQDEDFILEPLAYEMEPMLIPEGYVFVMGDNCNTSFDSHNWGLVIVNELAGQYEDSFPEGYVFVMGDNRNNSFDSHNWGLVIVNELAGQYEDSFGDVKTTIMKYRGFKSTDLLIASEKCCIIYLQAYKHILHLSLEEYILVMETGELMKGGSNYFMSCHCFQKLYAED